MSGVVGVQLSKPSNVSDFTDLLVANADALIAGAEDKDAEGCFQVLFQHIQVPFLGALAELQNPKSANVPSLRRTARRP